MYIFDFILLIVVTDINKTCIQNIGNSRVTRAVDFCWIGMRICYKSICEICLKRSAKLQPPVPNTTFSRFQMDEQKIFCYFYRYFQFYLRSRFYLIIYLFFKVPYSKGKSGY